MIEGRAPRGAGEILLGPRTLEALHRSVGDTWSSCERVEGSEMRIVGSGFALHRSSETAPWATGAVLTFQGLRRVRPTL